MSLMRNKTTLAVFHVTASPHDRALTAEDFRRQHKAMGWSDIGYNLVIRLNGKYEIGRGWDAVGAHVAGFNSTAIGIALVGGLVNGKPADTRTQAQKKTMLDLSSILVERYPGVAFCGHRDLSPDRDGDGVIEPHEWLKQCPCFDVIPWAEENGFKPAPIRGLWDDDNIVAIPSAAGKTIKAAGPDARNVYLQKLLAMAGYQFGPIDGLIGPRTVGALKSYQFGMGLQTTGQFDPPTVAMLRNTFERRAA